MLERLDHIRVGTADPAAAALDYTALLGLVASPRRVDPEDSGTGPDVWRVDVGTTGVVFAPSSGTSGTSSTRGTESGMQALVFAGQTDGPSCGFDSGAAVEIIEPSPHGSSLNRPHRVYLRQVGEPRLSSARLHAGG